MHEVIELDLSTLSPQLLSEYKKLTEPQFYPCFDSKDPWGVSSSIIFAVGALVDGKPVGLALASYRPTLEIARLVSIYIDVESRGLKIGTALLRKMEEVLRKQKCRLINHLYLTEQPTTPALEKIFQNQKWSKPYQMMVKCYFDCYAFNPPWFKRNYPIPSGFEMFSWGSLKSKEKVALIRQEKNNSFPANVSPFYREDTIEPINSLGLRNENGVVGWMITHRIDKDTIQYSSLYIDRDFKYLGHAMCLLANSIRKQQNSPVQWSILELNVQESDSHWISFVKKRLIPYTIKVEKFNEASRLL